MDFTREPIIETVITPREGYRLVVRSSKGAGSEEHFVDALEVVSFGSGVFFRSMERPKPFIVPVADYEVLEVREPRMVLKTPSDSQAKMPTQRLKAQAQEPKGEQPQQEAQAQPQEPKAERGDRRQGRRQRFRRRRGGREEGASAQGEEAVPGEQAPAIVSEELSSTPMLSSILPPPTKLIRDDLKRLREDYKGAFYINDDKDSMPDDDDASLATLGTTSEDEMSFREAPYSIADEDIRMSEGEVPQQEGSFHQEEANTSSSQDLP
ncbi:MAG: hypothetical protein JSR37_04370 [Verrucomicrobia bacterium]|nr:hypothetical protein [Verrucomicrobiota bacterium]MBS0635928.1 hypothetical protein [Verrucomicrobiota bacterium]